MIKVLIPEILHFDSGKVIDGKQKGRGYYFKGVFVSRYKSMVDREMRKNLEPDYSDEKKKVWADEVKVLDYFNKISKNATERTAEKKKLYYAQRRRETEFGNVAKEIAKLNFRIERLKKQAIDLETLKRTYKANIQKLMETQRSMENTP